MSTATGHSRFLEALVRLQGGSGAMPWSQRRELAVALNDALAAGGDTDAALALAHALATDPKWEVRCAIADLLPVLAGDDFDRLAARLFGDSNVYVWRAVQRALRGRHKESQRASRNRQSVDQVSEHLQDIDARYGKAAAAKALRMCQRYNELLVGSMVHDLRSILTRLRANATALAAESRAAGSPPRLGNRVKDDMDFLERTVCDMERFTASLAGTRMTTTLCGLVSSALEQALACVRHDPRLAAADVPVDSQVPAWIVVEVVPHLVVAALANIVKNAYESFAPPAWKGSQPRIWISAATVEAAAEITIRDNGMGFSPEERATLLPFTPGRRNKSKRNSTGYGLPNAIRNIASQGGTVGIDSGEDQGTTVTVRLPLKPGVAEHRP